jgi:hypothetical protein
MFLKRTSAVLAILGIALALPYACGPVYSFPAPLPFSGSKFLNPYAGAGPDWQRANLHAHGRAWNGLTNGRRQSDEQIVRAYRSFGYSVAGVSDYHHIAAFEGVATLPIYEHGYSLGKRHQLAIGARQVAWFDFPVGQTLSNQQFVIDRVAATSDLVALAHPSSRDAYTPDDLSRLTGYHLIEVLNGPFSFEEPWDAALSAGRAIWALGNDDTHDLTDARRTAMAWTMINAPSASLHDVVAALRAGQSYAVSRTNRIASAVETTLESVVMDNGMLEVTCLGEPSTFVFVGQNGNVKQTVKNALSASYAFGDDDTYVRTVIHAPRTTLYLNPVVRYDGSQLHAPAASINATGTWLLRASIVLAGGLGLFLLYRERRRPSLSRAPHPVLRPVSDRAES